MKCCDRCKDNVKLYTGNNDSEVDKLSKLCCTYKMLCLECINNLNDNLTISNMVMVIVVVDDEWIIK